MQLIKCDQLLKKYKGEEALRGVDLSIEENKLIGLVGRNGAGKTTLMKILAGMIKETSGRVEVFSRRPFNDLSVSANSIFIDDEMNFPPALKLYELLEEGRRFYPNWDHELALDLFDYFGFRKKAYYRNLSKGMESTFNMIVGLCARCPLTIFDEPTTGMDASVRNDFYRALLKDYIAHPRTILLSTHYLNEMEDMLEEVILLDRGRTYFHLSMADLSTYAIRLSGNQQIVEKWVQDRSLLHKRTYSNDVEIVVQNDYTDKEHLEMRNDGITLNSVKAADVCVYVTDHQEQEGGIDHVFDRNKTE